MGFTRSPKDIQQPKTLIGGFGSVPGPSLISNPSQPLRSPITLGSPSTGGSTTSVNVPRFMANFNRLARAGR